MLWHDDMLITLALVLILAVLVAAWTLGNGGNETLRPLYGLLEQAIRF